LGVLAINLNDQLRSVIGNLRISSGVVVIARAASLISPETGLRTGDIIHSVNTTPIDSVDTLRAALHTIKPNGAVVLQVERDGGLEWVSFELE
jgi:serine protease Do